MPQRLTDTTVARTTCPKDRTKPLELADEGHRGLRLRIHPSGRKVFFYRYQLPGESKQREAQLGVYPAMSLSDARDRWRQYAELRRQGIDPRAAETERTEQRLAAAREREAAEKKARFTFEKLAKAFLEAASTEGATSFKRSWAEDKRILERYFIPSLGSCPALEVDRAAIEAALAPLRLAGRVVQSNRAVACVRRVFRWGTEAGVLPAPHDPAAGIKQTRERSRDRHLSDTELRAFLAWLDPKDAGHRALRFALLTAQRAGEVVSAHARNIRHGVWTIPTTKSGEPQQVILSAPAAAMVKGRQGWIFPADTSSGHVRVDRLSKITAAASKQLGLEAFTAHDCRRTAATWLGEQLAPDAVVKRILNHRDAGVTAVYQRARLNAHARDWWERWGAHVAALEQPNVVPLDGSKSKENAS